VVRWQKKGRSMSAPLQGLARQDFIQRNFQRQDTSTPPKEHTGAGEYQPIGSGFSCKFGGAWELKGDRDAARIRRDATLFGVGGRGFAEGFLVMGSCLMFRRRNRMCLACLGASDDDSNRFA